MMTNEDLRLDFLNLNADEVTQWMSDQGVSATPEELEAFMCSRPTGRCELSDDELFQVAGGKGSTGQVAASVLVTWGCPAVTANRAS